MFRIVLLSIIRSFLLYTQQWYMLYSEKLLMMDRGLSETCSVLFQK